MKPAGPCFMPAGYECVVAQVISIVEIRDANRQIGGEEVGFGEMSAYVCHPRRSNLCPHPCPDLCLIAKDRDKAENVSL